MINYDFCSSLPPRLPGHFTLNPAQIGAVITE